MINAVAESGEDVSEYTIAVGSLVELEDGLSAVGDVLIEHRDDIDPTKVIVIKRKSINEVIEN
jgi:hypothetical protein